MVESESLRENDGMEKWLKSYVIESKNEDYVQPLLFNIKTHKPKKKQVGMRLIHSASSHPARAISYVLKQELLEYEKKTYSRLPHNI